jgi:hypothetical protein
MANFSCAKIAAEELPEHEFDGRNQLVDRYGAAVDERTSRIVEIEEDERRK